MNIVEFFESLHVPLFIAETTRDLGRVQPLGTHSSDVAQFCWIPAKMTMGVVWHQNIGVNDELSAPALVNAAIRAVLGPDLNNSVPSLRLPYMKYLLESLDLPLQELCWESFCNASFFWEELENPNKTHSSVGKDLALAWRSPQWGKRCVMAEQSGYLHWNSETKDWVPVFGHGVHRAWEKDDPTTPAAQKD